MNEFKEKWNSDVRFKVKIKLTVYTLFVIFVAIFAISNRTQNATGEQNDQYEDNDNISEKTDNIIKIPSEYNYTINITINDNNYQYSGIKKLQRESITKESNGNITNYIYEGKNYYKEENDKYVLSTKEEVYDIINYDYINLDTINKYLLKSIKVDNQYLVYLKDIILGNTSDEYITITTEQNNINLNYTALIKNFDKTIEKYLISINLKNIE